MGQHLDSGYHGGPKLAALPPVEKHTTKRPPQLQIQTSAASGSPSKEPGTEIPLFQIESANSVCHSPTWEAVNDQKKRKRAWKEKLAKEKRLEKEKEALEKKIRKVDGKRRLDDQKDVRPLLDLTSDVKPRRPSFTLRRLSIVSAGPEFENEERKSKRLSKSRRSSISGDQLQPDLDRRPSLLSRKNGRWSQSFPNFPFRTLPRLKKTRSGKELADKGQRTLKNGVEVVGGERSTLTSNGSASENQPEGGGASARETKTPSQEVSSNEVASHVICTHSELQLIPHSKHQRKLARKAAITSQSPRQLYSQYGSRDQKTNGYPSKILQSDPLKVAADHSSEQAPQFAAVSGQISNNQSSVSFPLRQHPPSGEYQETNRGFDSTTQGPTKTESQNFSEKIPNSTALRRERSDKLDAQILEWNEQVTSQGQEAVVQDSMKVPQRRIARRQLKQKGVDIKQIGASKSEIPLKSKEHFQSPEQTPAEQDKIPHINADQSPQPESAIVLDTDETSGAKSSDKKYKDREGLWPKRPNPPTRPWTWTLPFSSLWQANADAVSENSDMSTSSTSSKEAIEEPDTALVSPSQGQRSRCSSTTIKPRILGQTKAEVSAEPAVPILNVPNGSYSQTDQDPREQCNANRNEDRRHSVSSQLVDATLLDLKLHNLGAGLRPGERERRSSPLGPDIREPNVALTSGPTRTTNERRLSTDNPDWIQISHKVPSPKKSTPPIQTNAPKFATLAVPRADLPHSRNQSTFKESQEKVSISDGSESISHFSTKSTSLSSSFDKCSLPPGTSANNYGANPVSVSRKSLNRSTSSKTGHVAKIFIVCCRCCRWHDPPAAYFQDFITHAGKAVTIIVPGQTGGNPSESTSQDKTGIAGKEKSKFACHWCDHEMSRQCCASWTSLCSFHQRHWARPDSQG